MVISKILNDFLEVRFMKINKQLLLLNCIPIMITLAFSIVWFSDRTANRIIVNHLSSLQVFLDWFVFPFYLIFLNGAFHKKNKKYLFIDKIIFMSINLFVVNKIHFYSWSISSKLVNYADRQSTLFPHVAWQVPLYLILTGGIIIQIVLVIEWLISKAE